MIVKPPQAAELALVLQDILQLVFAKWNTIFTLPQITFNCFVHRRICCIATFLPNFTGPSLDSLQCLLVFPLFWLSFVSWITAGPLPAVPFVFMATCLLLWTLGIFWDPVSKALTSCHLCISLLQLISFSTSRHTNSQTICYQTVPCSSAAQPLSPS